ncbi:MAG TPA: hypothetical protein EYH02_05910 [Ignisphaera aggregans]|uniref:Uncharacterized protein n=1 Tax=Ignisphaera aggregans TaxID=334771 RepID=A0A833DTS0_9CREN|nr:hypothetical protein [Ignisphaera aggregans]
MGCTLRIYRNEDVKRVIAFIPPGHRHVRLLIELKDQTILLQEASVAAIVRAYIDVVTHPNRKAIELTISRLPSSERKPGYAEYQLIESGRSEEDVIAEVLRMLECSSESR